MTVPKDIPGTLIAHLLRDASPKEAPPIVSGVPRKAVRRRAPVRS